MDRFLILVVVVVGFRFCFLAYNLNFELGTFGVRFYFKRKFPRSFLLFPSGFYGFNTLFGGGMMWREENGENEIRGKNKLLEG